MQALVVPTATIIAVGAPAVSPPGDLAPNRNDERPSLGIHRKQKGRALSPAFLYLLTVVRLDQ